MAKKTRGASTCSFHLATYKGQVADKRERQMQIQDRDLGIAGAAPAGAGAGADSRYLLHHSQKGEAITELENRKCQEAERPIDLHNPGPG